MSKEILPGTPAFKLKTLKDALNAAAPSMSAVAASIVTPERLIKIVLGVAQRTPLLLECTAASIVRSVMQGAELGCIPGSALQLAHLMPFKQKDGSYEAQLVLSAQGLADLMYRSGLVSWVTAEPVYKGDKFEYELGIEPKLKHTPCDESVDSADITHVYMVARMKDGSTVFRVMGRKAVDRIMQRSPSVKGGGFSPWTSDYAEMAKKTVLKNGSKYMPKSIEVARAVALDNAQETGDWSGVEFELPDSNIIEGEVTGSPTVDRVTEKVGEVGDPGEFSLETPAGPEVLGPFNLTSSEVKDLEKLAKSKGKNLFNVAASLEIKSLEGLTEALEA